MASKNDVISIMTHFNYFVGWDYFAIQTLLKRKSGKWVVEIESDNPYCILGKTLSKSYAILDDMFAEEVYYPKLTKQPPHRKYLDPDCDEIPDGWLRIEHRRSDFREPQVFEYYIGIRDTTEAPQQPGDGDKENE